MVNSTIILAAKFFVLTNPVNNNYIPLTVFEKRVKKKKQKSDAFRASLFCSLFHYSSITLIRERVLSLLSLNI